MLIQKISLALKEPHFEIWARVKLFILSVQYNETFKTKIHNGTQQVQQALSDRDFTHSNLPQKSNNFFETSVFSLEETKRIWESLVNRFNTHKKNQKLSSLMIPYNLMAQLYQHMATHNPSQKIACLQNAHIIFELLAQQAWLLAHHNFLPENKIYFSPHEHYIRKTIQYLESAIAFRKEINMPIDKVIQTLRQMEIMSIYIRDFESAESLARKVHSLEDAEKYNNAPRHVNKEVQISELERTRFYRLEQRIFNHADGLPYVMIGAIGLPQDLYQALIKTNKKSFLDACESNNVTDNNVTDNIDSLLKAIEDDVGIRDSLFQKYFSITATPELSVDKLNALYLAIKQKFVTDNFSFLNRSHPNFQDRIPLQYINKLERLTQNMANTNNRFMAWLYVLVYSMLEKNFLVTLQIPQRHTVPLETLDLVHSTRNLLFKPHSYTNFSNEIKHGCTVRLTTHSIDITPEGDAANILHQIRNYLNSKNISPEKILLDSANNVVKIFFESN
ncbi:MAG: hypothetical protein WBM13_10270, partial [Bacteroidia bacterium]